MSKGLTLLETTSANDRANGLRSFTLEHETRDTRRLVALTVHSSENIAGRLEQHAVWTADGETNIRNVDLAELLTAFNLHLLRVCNLSQLPAGPITIA